MLLSAPPAIISVTTLYVIIALAALSYVAVQKRWLTTSGAIAAGCMGFVFYTTTGWAGFACPLLFLISGSLLSKLNREAREKNGRKAIQVLANGLPGATCYGVYAFTQQPIWLEAAVLSFGISMSDSISAEAGKYTGGRTIDITSLKPVEAGLSGGISFWGSAFGLLAAAALVITGKLAFGLPWPTVLPLSLTAFAGMLTDSLLGSLLQAKYRDPAGAISDYPAPGSVLVRGVKWCNNDIVNLLANVLIVIIFLLVS